MSQAIWRIGTVTPAWSADDTTGIGAYITGGRWNYKDTHMLYCAETRAMCCLETLVHLVDDPLPFNRFLVRYDIPDEVWDARAIIDVDTAPGGWDALPYGMPSMKYGTNWARHGAQAVHVVPSVVIPEETNVLLNPAHPDMKRITATIVRRWTYDTRLRA